MADFSHLINVAPFPVEGRRTLLLTDGLLSLVDSKTAACFLMYRPDDAVAVLDATHAGMTPQRVIGFGGDCPIVATLDEALALEPEQAIVGAAPMGGSIDAPLRAQIIGCLDAGVDVISGMHVELGRDEEIASHLGDARVWDARAVPPLMRVSRGGGCTTGAKTVLTVGTDCNVGKMTVAVELCAAANRRGRCAAWAATGQTGIILRGRGIAVDHVIADFIGGATEALVDYEGRDAEVVFVEGQGAILHPGYAGVTLGLMYGAMPDAMVLVHTADRDHFKRLDIALPPIRELIATHEQLMRPYRRSRIACIALNTHALSEVAAREAIDALTHETALPVADVIRDGADTLLDAVEASLREADGPSN